MVTGEEVPVAVNAVTVGAAVSVAGGGVGPGPTGFSTLPLLLPPHAASNSAAAKHNVTHFSFMMLYSISLFLRSIYKLYSKSNRGRCRRGIARCIAADIRTIPFSPVVKRPQPLATTANVAV
jgi:hypothetical protein